MKLPKIAIDNYQFTLVVVALLLMVGITSFKTSVIVVSFWN